MTYIKTTLKREIAIDSIITIHYFEYMKDFVFHGESHDFWEFLYVDQGSVIVQAGENHFRMEAGDIIFHEPNEFHAVRSVGNSSRVLSTFGVCKYKHMVHNALQH